MSDFEKSFSPTNNPLHNKFACIVLLLHSDDDLDLPLSVIKAEIASNREVIEGRDYYRCLICDYNGVSPYNHIYYRSNIVDKLSIHNVKSERFTRLCEYFKVDANTLMVPFESKGSNGRMCSNDVFPMFKSKMRFRSLDSLMRALGVTYESICDLKFTSKDLKHIGVTSEESEEMFFSRLDELLSMLKKYYKKGEGELALKYNNPIEVNNLLEPNNENNGNAFQRENDAPDFDDSVGTNNVLDNEEHIGLNQENLLTELENESDDSSSESGTINENGKKEDQVESNQVENQNQVESNKVEKQLESQQIMIFEKGEVSKKEDERTKRKRKDLDDSDEDLSDSKEDLDDSKEDLSDSKEDLNDSKEDLDGSKENLYDSKEVLNYSKGDLDEPTREKVVELEEKILKLKEKSYNLGVEIETIIKDANDDYDMEDHAKAKIKDNEHIMHGKRGEIKKQQEEITRKQEKITRKQEKITRQQEEITRQQEEITRQQEKLKRQEEKFTRQEEKLKRHKEEFTRQQEELKRQEDHLREMESDGKEISCELALTIEKIHTNMEVVYEKDEKITRYMNTKKKLKKELKTLVGLDNN